MGGGGLNNHIKIFSCYRKIWSWDREDNYTVGRGLSGGSMDVKELHELRDFGQGCGKTCMILVQGT